MPRFLVIQNPGICDHRVFTMIGVSTSRNNALLIGEFGSGSKFAVTTLLRNNIDIHIHAGNLKMEFFKEPTFIQGETFNRIKVKYSGKDVFGNTKNTTEDLNMVTDWGTKDWRVGMAIREFISNAIDACIAQGKTAQDVEFILTDKPRAKANCTQVFIEYTGEVEAYYEKLPKYFLHYSGFNTNDTFITRKADEPCRIYKKGVLVCELKKRGLYHYNLGDELRLDESRNADPWDVKYWVAKRIEKETSDKIKPIIKAVVENQDVWERDLELSPTEKSKEFWKKNFQELYGEKAALVSSPIFHQYLLDKGKIPVNIENGDWRNFLVGCGVQDGEALLNKVEKDGKTTEEATPAAVEMLDKVWNLLERLKMTNGKEKPKIKGFRQLLDAGCQLYGYWDADIQTVFIESTLNSGPQLFWTTLEELSHCCSGAGDASRDFQSYLFRMITEMASNSMIVGFEI